MAWLLGLRGLNGRNPLKRNPLRTERFLNHDLDTDREHKRQELLSAFHAAADTAGAAIFYLLRVNIPKAENGDGESGDECCTR